MYTTDVGPFARPRPSIPRPNWEGRNLFGPVRPPTSDATAMATRYEKPIEAETSNLVPQEGVTNFAETSTTGEVTERA